MAGPAELIADRGAAAQDEEFFRSRQFLDAEGVTHTLRLRSDHATLTIPVICHEVPRGQGIDAISPYGYPGGTSRPPGAPPPNPAEIDWGPTGLVSLFVRDRVLGEPCLASPTDRSMLQLHDPSAPRRVRSRFAEQIRRNRRLGYSTETIDGVDASVAERESFLGVYLATMRRAQAAERYLYERDYIDSLLSFGRSWLVLARAPDGAVAAAAIAALSDQVLHYFLGGTADEHLPQSPFKNLAEAMMDLADRLEVVLNLGGGASPGDGLEDFKRGFANRQAPFRTHEVICDSEAYARLTQDRSSEGFFPAYRAPL